jgi:hypothetical protein
MLPFVFFYGIGINLYLATIKVSENARWPNGQMQRHRWVRGGWLPSVYQLVVNRIYTNT